MPKRSDSTYDLARRKIGDFDPVPADEYGDRPPAHGTETLVDQLLNPRQPLESGTWTAAGGYVRDVSEDERAALIAKVKHAAMNSPRTAWKKGQSSE